MAQDREARIVVSKGKTADLSNSNEVGVYEPATGKYTKLGSAPAKDVLLAEHVGKMAEQLKRAGNRVSYKEM